MDMNLTIPTHRRARIVATILAALALAGFAPWSLAADTAASNKADDGWQVLSGAMAAPALTAPALTAGGTAAEQPAASHKPGDGAAFAQARLAVTPVVLPGAPSAPAGDLTFTVTPQDINLRNALDRWLQTQGWQLAWKIDDDLPLEFNATFTGDFTSILRQVMQATNHMRTPTRVCRHTNKVIRVVARAANCKD